MSTVGNSIYPPKASPAYEMTEPTTPLLPPVPRLSQVTQTASVALPKTSSPESYFSPGMPIRGRKHRHQSQQKQQQQEQSRSGLEHPSTSTSSRNGNIDNDTTSIDSNYSDTTSTLIHVLPYLNKPLPPLPPSPRETATKTHTPATLQQSSVMSRLQGFKRPSNSKGANSRSESPKRPSFASGSTTDLVIAPSSSEPLRRLPLPPLEIGYGPKLQTNQVARREFGHGHDGSDDHHDHHHHQRKQRDQRFHHHQSHQDLSSAPGQYYNGFEDFADDLPSLQDSPRLFENDLSYTRTRHLDNENDDDNDPETMDGQSKKSKSFVQRMLHRVTKTLNRKTSKDFKTDDQPSQQQQASTSTLGDFESTYHPRQAFDQTHSAAQVFRNQFHNPTSSSSTPPISRRPVVRRAPLLSFSQSDLPIPSLKSRFFASSKTSNKGTSPSPSFPGVSTTTTTTTTTTSRNSVSLSQSHLPQRPPLSNRFETAPLLSLPLAFPMEPLLPPSAAAATTATFGSSSSARTSRLWNHDNRPIHETPPDRHMTDRFAMYGGGSKPKTESSRAQVAAKLKSSSDENDDDDDDDDIVQYDTASRVHPFQIAVPPPTLRDHHRRQQQNRNSHHSQQRSSRGSVNSLGVTRFIESQASIPSMGASSAYTASSLSSRNNEPYLINSRPYNRRAVGKTEGSGVYEHHRREGMVSSSTNTINTTDKRILNRHHHPAQLPIAEAFIANRSRSSRHWGSESGNTAAINSFRNDRMMNKTTNVGNHSEMNDPSSRIIKSLPIHLYPDIRSMTSPPPPALPPKPVGRLIPRRRQQQQQQEHEFEHYTSTDTDIGGSSEDQQQQQQQQNRERYPPIHAPTPVSKTNSAAILLARAADAAAEASSRVRKPVQPTLLTLKSKGTSLYNSQSTGSNSNSGGEEGQGLIIKNKTADGGIRGGDGGGGGDGNGNGQSENIFPRTAKFSRDKHPKVLMVKGKVGNRFETQEIVSAPLFLSITDLPAFPVKKSNKDGFLSMSSSSSSSLLSSTLSPIGLRITNPEIHNTNHSTTTTTTVDTNNTDRNKPIKHKSSGRSTENNFDINNLHRKSHQQHLSNSFSSLDHPLSHQTQQDPHQPLSGDLTLLHSNPKNNSSPQQELPPPLLPPPPPPRRRERRNMMVNGQDCVLPDLDFLNNISTSNSNSHKVMSPAAATDALASLIKTGPLPSMIESTDQQIERIPGTSVVSAPKTRKELETEFDTGSVLNTRLVASHHHRRRSYPPRTRQRSDDM